MSRTSRAACRVPCKRSLTRQRRGALMISFICAWTNGWMNNRVVGYLRRYRAHHDVTVMGTSSFETTGLIGAVINNAWYYSTQWRQCRACLNPRHCPRLRAHLHLHCPSIRVRVRVRDTDRVVFTLHPRLGSEVIRGHPRPRPFWLGKGRLFNL